jgi:hypothetical protein
VLAQAGIARALGNPGPADFVEKGRGEEIEGLYWLY